MLSQIYRSERCLHEISSQYCCSDAKYHGKLCSCHFIYCISFQQLLSLKVTRHVCFRCVHLVGMELNLSITKRVISQRVCVTLQNLLPINLRSFHLHLMLTDVSMCWINYLLCHTYLFKCAYMELKVFSTNEILEKQCWLLKLSLL